MVKDFVRARTCDSVLYIFNKGGTRHMQDNPAGKGKKWKEKRKRISAKHTKKRKKRKKIRNKLKKQRKIHFCSTTLSYTLSSTLSSTPHHPHLIIRLAYGWIKEEKVT